MNDPLALKMDKPLGSWPASRTSRLLLVMEVETKRHRFIYATGMRGSPTKGLMQRGIRAGCQGEHQHGVEGCNPRDRGVAAQGSPVLTRFLELAMLVGTTSPMVKTHWEMEEKP